MTRGRVLGPRTTELAMRWGAAAARDIPCFAPAAGVTPVPCAARARESAPPRSSRHQPRWRPR